MESPTLIFQSVQAFRPTALPFYSSSLAYTKVPQGYLLTPEAQSSSLSSQIAPGLRSA